MLFNNKYNEMEKRYNKLNKFIEKAKKIFGDKYDYSLVNYIDSIKKVKIICKEHNIIFEQSPSEHLRGKKSCSKCQDRTKNTESIIKKLYSVHKDKYDYSLVKYIDSKTKIKIICPEHGVFLKLPSAYKQGCPKCFNNKRSEINKKDTNSFIVKSKEKHGDKYDYRLVEYKTNKEPVKIICPVHGEFEQLPYNHLRGKGCVKCKNDNLILTNRKTTENFIKDSNKIHNEKYDYKLSEYINAKNNIKIICPIHGEFEQRAECHINGHGCQKCANVFNKMQNELKHFIESLNVDVIYNDRKQLNGKELDIYIPSHKIAIEFNGLYWHSELYKDSNYHLTKTELCNSNNIRLIQIFEDEWLFRNDIVKSRLKNILGLTNSKIYARKTEIREVTTIESNDFLEKNHIQGSVNSKFKIGLFYNNELVSLMTFGKERKSLGKISTDNNYELIRFCNKLDFNIVGGASKLLNYFIKNYKPNEIFSYADKRWSNGELYKKLGFNLIHDTKPNYWYIVGKNRKHRFGYRKDILIKEGYDKNKTEHQIMLERKLYRIYDCGSIFYRLDF